MVVPGMRPLLFTRLPANGSKCLVPQLDHSPGMSQVSLSSMGPVKVSIF
jgi:hypothetical protein